MFNMSAEKSSSTKTSKTKKAKKKSSSGMFEKVVPILLVTTIALAFGVGVLWQKVNQLEDSGGTSKTEVAVNNVADDQAPPAPPSSGKLDEEQAEKIPQVAVSSADSKGDEGENVKVVTTGADHIMGSTDFGVYIIEYSDFECPFCQRFHPTVQQALDEYDGKVAWVYRHYPLTFIHSKAQEAAESSECVAELGGNDAFWEFTGLVFEDSPNTLSNLSELAVEVGVNQAEFEECVESERYKDLVQEQLDAGTAAGITGTPGTVVVNANGDTWLVPGAVPYESLKDTIDQALGA